jgi:hypothetical protein
MRLHNKTILDKPFIFDINPAYSTNAKTFSGSGFVVNQNYRNSAQRATPFLALFPLCSRCCLFENQSDGAAKH